MNVIKLQKRIKKRGIIISFNNYFHTRISRYGKIIERVWSHNGTSLYSKVRFPTYWCSILLDVCITFQLPYFWNRIIVYLSLIFRFMFLCSGYFKTIINVSMIQPGEKLIINAVFFATISLWITNEIVVLLKRSKKSLFYY